MVVSEIGEARVCRACGTELIGRVDKQFCDSRCRATYWRRSNPRVQVTRSRLHQLLDEVLDRHLEDAS
jgi:hypothetical protein